MPVAVCLREEQRDGFASYQAHPLASYLIRGKSRARDSTLHAYSIDPVAFQRPIGTRVGNDRFFPKPVSHRQANYQDATWQVLGPPSEKKNNHTRENKSGQEKELNKGGQRTQGNHVLLLCLFYSSL